MIEGIHVLLYSKEAEAVRAFLLDTFSFGLADATPDWPIFTLPPAELGVHPIDGETRAELYLMTRDIEATLDELRAKGVAVIRGAEDQGWGLVSAVRLPDGSELPIYQPKHGSVLDSARG